MASIYASSYLTIAATQSKNANDSLYGEPPSEWADQVYWFGSSNAAYPVYARTHKRHDRFSQSKLPLLPRAWAFQERILSPRVVHFGDSELYWECFAGTKHESVGILPYASFSNSKTNFLGTYKNSSYRWQLMVSRYSLLSLTYEKDIFSAIKGIAKIFQAERKCAYYAGLWEDSSLFDLLWKRGELTTKSGPYRAPSWSWASSYKLTHTAGRVTGRYGTEHLHWVLDGTRKSEWRREPASSPSQPRQLAMIVWARSAQVRSCLGDDACLQWKENSRSRT